MCIVSITSEVEYQLALKKLEELFDAPIGTLESDEADELIILIDDYEKKNYPM